jgi:hypothetical protein
MPVFFTSYASDDNEQNKLHDAVKRIEARVRAFMGADEEAEIAFFARQSIETGQQWEQRLGGVLRDTKLIVCMCSPRFVNSAYCAKEFEVFRRRLAAVAGPAEGKVAIIPIVWEPGTLPAAIARFQFTDIRLPEAYGKTVGLSQLIRLPSQADKLDDTIEVLAEIINKADDDTFVLPPFPGAIEFDSLPSFPHSPNPAPYKNVTLTVLHANRAQWKMGGNRRNIAALVDEAAKSLDVSLEIVDPNPVDLQQHLDAARQRRHISLVVIAYDDAAKAPWQQMLAGIDQAARSNCAVLVGWKQSELPSAADIQMKLKQLLPTSATPAAKHAALPLGDEKGCKDALTSAIAALQMALIAEDAHLAQTVKSQVLSEGAAKKGIEVDKTPTVSASSGDGS